MIGAAHEQTQDGQGADFFDSVSIDFCDPEHDLFGLAWMTRLPGANRARANLLLFAGGELAERLRLESDAQIDDWSDARLDDIRMSITAPLERWSLEAAGPATVLALDAEAVTAPREQPDREPLEVAGIDQYEQLCRVTGTVKVLGREHRVRCLGRRAHASGSFAWSGIERWRALYAASASGRAISVLTALPAGSSGHGQEVRSARLLDEDEPEKFEDVFVSTVYGADGLPAKVGLELWTGDEEIPQRLGGEAICGVRAEHQDHELSVSFFRWSIEGEPAYGCYEVAHR